MVDPQLVKDALEGESAAGKRAIALFEAHKADDLILAPTSYIALSPAFMGIRSMQDRFIETIGVRVTRNAPAKVMDAAYSAWSRYQQDNPRIAGGNSVFDQLYIGAYALLYDGILTRQGALRGLLERGHVESVKRGYAIGDPFFARYIREMSASRCY